MLIVYQFIGYILLPFIKLNIYLRILNNKEDKKRYSERFGITSMKTPKGKLIWIHAASVGEFKSATLIINKLYKKFNILITTTTLAAANYATENYNDKIIHQYAPFDIPIWVKRFLKKWNPVFVLWIESDLWPTTLALIKKNSIKSILLNSRISPKSFNKWKYIKFFYTNITNTFNEIFSQSLLDKKRLEILTKRKINYIGNLKLASIEKSYDKEKIKDLRAKLSDYKILMLASTHVGEEKIFINLIKKFLLKYKRLKIIVAPRHIERSKYILKIFNNEKIKSNIFDNSLNLEEDVFLINSFGKMNFYYALSDIVILGGSFVKMGGHNPVEPALNNCVVITGPHIYNWENVYCDMINFKACLKCNNINELDQCMISLLQNDEKIKLLKSKARKFTENNFFEIDKLFSIIDNNFRYK